MTRPGRWWPLLAHAALTHAAYAAVRPMVGYRAVELDGGTAAIGALSASFSILPLVLALPVGRQVDRFGAPRLVAAGGVLFAAACAAAVFAAGVGTLLVPIALLGLGQLAVLVGQQAMAATIRPGNRDQAFGTLTSVAAGGQILGPLLATAAASRGPVSGWTAANLGTAVAAVLALGAVPLSRWLLSGGGPRPDPGVRPPPVHRAAGALVRIPGMWPALAAGGVVLAALDLLQVFLPVWAQDRGVSPTAVGALLALRAGATLLARLLAARMVRRIGRRAGMVGSILAAGAGLALVPLVDPAGAVAVMVVLGVGLGMAQPLSMGWVVELAAPGTQGSALGLRLSANRLAQTVVPLGVGVAAAGPSAVFWSTSLLLGGASVALLRAPPGTSEP
ncbi:MFS transporter [Plantactinospora sp. KBS50]|uniref:MFS transporter n=1 Tax=Plantactinospora sp. KBS50 TaxID=2024580 RepID=UPI000BAA96C3|nr:MFS transporter [Plantactinospora sp. KBS50]ASW54155.1 hypothetical protein CIK06_08045 [Plantactinospora sp. KBS50]